MSAALAAALALVAGACSSSTASTGSSATTLTAGTSSCKNASQNSNVVALPGYQVCLLIPATTTANHPDNVVYDGTNIWIGWQNITAKDGTDTKTSTIAQYTTSGKLVKSWTVPGHTDGMRNDPTSHLMWVMCDEDGKPRLYTIDPSSASPTTYTLPDPTSWGGGFDDIQFVNGAAYSDASNPSLNSAGQNTNPILYKITLSSGKATLTPVLTNKAKAISLNPPIAPVSLNVTDPDSMMIDPQGDLVLDAQADQQLLIIHGLGTSAQTIKVLAVGTPVDDTVWPTSTKGCMIIADNASGVYSVCSSLWVTTTPLTAAPNDSTIISFVGALGLGSGQITPVIVGMNNPHGMAFIPQ
jgi:hypothetical protein